MDLASVLGPQPAPRPPIAAAEPRKSAAETSHASFDDVLQTSITDAGPERPASRTAARHAAQPSPRAPAHPARGVAACGTGAGVDAAPQPADGTEHGAAESAPAVIVARTGDSTDRTRENTEAATSETSRDENAPACSNPAVDGAETAASPAAVPISLCPGATGETAALDADSAADAIGAADDATAVASTVASEFAPVATSAAAATSEVPDAALQPALVSSATVAPVTPTGADASAARNGARESGSANAAQSPAGHVPTAPEAASRPVNRGEPEAPEVPVASEAPMAPDVTPFVRTDPLAEAGSPPRAAVDGMGSRLDPFAMPDALAGPDDSNGSAASPAHPLSALAARVKTLVMDAARPLLGTDSRAAAVLTSRAAAEVRSVNGTPAGPADAAALEWLAVEATDAPVPLDGALAPDSTITPVRLMPVAHGKAQAMARAIVRATVEGLALTNDPPADAIPSPASSRSVTTAPSTDAAPAPMPHLLAVNPVLARQEARMAYAAEQAIAPAADTPALPPVAPSAETLLNQEHSSSGNPPAPRSAPAALVGDAPSTPFPLPSFALGETFPLAPPHGEAASGGSSVTLAQLPQQIVRTIRVQVQGGVSEARLRLNPAHLGEVTVKLRVEGEGVRAVLHAESPRVSAWIEAHQEDLRSALGHLGLQLERLTVTTDPDDGRQEPDDGMPRPRPRTAREKREAKTFEITI